MLLYCAAVIFCVFLSRESSRDRAGGGGGSINSIQSPTPASSIAGAFTREENAKNDRPAVSLTAPPGNSAMRCACFLFDRSLMEGKSEEILPFFPFFPNTVTLDALQISALLMHKRWKEAHELLDTYPPEILGDEYSPLFVPM